MDTQNEELILEDDKKNLPLDYEHILNLNDYTKEINTFDKSISRKALKEFRKALMKTYVDTHLASLEFLEFIEMNINDLYRNTNFSEEQKAECFELAKKAVNGEAVSEHKLKEFGGIYNSCYVILTNLQEAQRKVAEKLLYLKRIEELDKILRNKIF